MLSRLLEQKGEERLADAQKSKNQIENGAPMGGQTGFSGYEKIMRNTITRDSEITKQGSFLSVLGEASQNAARQRRLKETTKQIEYDLLMAERDTPSAPDSNQADVPSQAGPVQPQPVEQPQFHAQPQPQTQPYPHAQPQFQQQGQPVYQQAQPGPSEYYQQPAPAPDHAHAPQYASPPQYGTAGMPQAASEQQSSASRSVEEQLDLLNDKLSNVRSRFQSGQSSTQQPAQQELPLRQSGQHQVPLQQMPPQQAPVNQNVNQQAAAVEQSSTQTTDETNHAAAYGPNPLSFEGMIGTVIRSWKWIVLGGLVGGLVGSAYALTLPNKYESIAEILIEPRGLRVVDNNVAPNGLNSEATVAYAESQINIIRSSSVLDPVIDQLKLEDDSEFNGTGEVGGLLKSLSGVLGVGKGEPRGNRRDMAREYLQENMWVSRMNQTFAIRIATLTESPEKSQAVTDAIARSYIKDESGARSSAARNASDDLSRQLPALSQRVEASERKVEEHRKEHNLVSLGDRSANQVQLERLTDQTAIAKVRTGEARVRANAAEKADLSDVVSGTLPSSVSSPALKQLRAQYASAEANIKSLAVKLGVKHPKRVAAEAQLGGIRDSIRKEIKRLVASTREDYNRAKLREGDLKAQVNGLESTLSEDSAAEVKLRELERNLEADKKLYETFLMRARETNELENIRTDSARLISTANLPYEKEGPNRKVIALMSAAIGAFLFSLLVLIPLVFRGLKQFAAQATGEKPQAPRQPQPQQQPVGGHDLYSAHPVPQAPPPGAGIYSDWAPRS